MKKVLAILLLAMVCVGFVCAAEKDFSNMDKAPALNVEGAYVYDLKPFHKNVNDNFAFYNMTDFEGLKGRVFYVDTKTGEWVEIRDRYELKDYNDRDIVEPGRKVKLKKVPFIAFTVEPVGDYEFKVYAKSHDINIEIYKK